MDAVFVNPAYSNRMPFTASLRELLAERERMRALQQKPISPEKMAEFGDRLDKAIASAKIEMKLATQPNP
jgi:hypothetical protein